LSSITLHILRPKAAYAVVYLEHQDFAVGIGCPPLAGPAFIPAANKALVRRYFDERWNHGSVAICDELLAPSMDIQGQKAYVTSMLAAYGDAQLAILDLIAEGDQVAIHWRFSGIHRGEHMGVAATGKPVSFAGIALLRVIDGKIVDDIAYWDSLEIMQQLGAAPAA